MERRNFIKNTTCTTIAGMAVINGLHINKVFGFPAGSVAGIDVPVPQASRLVVKPVMTNMYHTDQWCGPCRFEIVTMEEEKRRALESFENFRKGISGNTQGINLAEVEMLEPALVLFVEDFKIKEEDYNKIDQDARKADVLFISPAGASKATFDIASRYGKPVILDWGLNCRTVDIAAYCRSHGIETFIPDKDLDMAGILSLLRARKIFRETKILYPTNWGWPSVASITGINEPEKLKDMYGIELVRISYDELSAEMDKLLQDRQALDLADDLAEELFKNAEHSYIEKKYVAKSMLFYQAVISLMNRHGCNAFTIECFEFCTSRLPEKWNITPCMIHTMFKDTGIPSACEGDLGALLAMQMLMTVSGKSPHLGNMFYRENGIMEVNHSVPGIKMNGFDKPGLPYQLGRFTQCNWGTKAVVDFMQNGEKNVTVVRMNPAGTGLLVLNGQLTGSDGWGEDRLGCAVSAFIVGKESGSAHEFMKKQADYGNHLCWVYGDCTSQLKKLGELMGVDVVVES
jgi:thiol-disulfide isomerase/thioredoxin